VRLDRLAALALAGGLVAGCSNAADPATQPNHSAAKPAAPTTNNPPAEDAVRATRDRPAEETSVTDRPIQLQIPAGVSPEQYQRVRADATLGEALDRAMIPALERAGAPAERLAAFEQARATALAAWQPALTAEEAASKATGPMEHPGRKAFDLVSTDVLRAWFIQTAEAAAADAPRDDAIAAITDLEARARASFGWDATTAESVAVRVMLVRAGLEQAAPR
jgi:hypothetical protein